MHQLPHELLDDLRQNLKKLVFFMKILGKLQQGLIYGNFRLPNSYLQTHSRYHLTAIERLTMLQAFYFERWNLQYDSSTDLFVKIYQNPKSNYYFPKNLWMKFIGPHWNPVIPRDPLDPCNFLTRHPRTHLTHVAHRPTQPG